MTAGAHFTRQHAGHDRVAFLAADDRSSGRPLVVVGYEVSGATMIFAGQPSFL
ncbi:MAG TPA: hypothetical protein VFB99_02165 [Vicinamibacterales bacterium]|nr:hypothetical protein [Vicinamibacterales bacterium]